MPSHNFATTSKNGKPSCLAVSGKVSNRDGEVLGAACMCSCRAIQIPGEVYIARGRKDEAVLIKEIHKLAIRHSRYGYHRITVLL